MSKRPLTGLRKTEEGKVTGTAAKVYGKRRQGIVLVITLVILASLSFMASFLYFKAHRIRKEAFLLERQALAEKFLPQIMETVFSLLALYQQNYGSVPPKVSFNYRGGKIIQAGHIDLELSPEEKRCNLNQKDEEALLACLVEAGLSQEEALSLRDAVLDWTDKDDLPRPFGAEKEAYEGYQPANAPFKDLLEVLLVKGFDPYQLWGPEGLFNKITVYAPSAPAKKEKEPNHKENRKDQGKAPSVLAEEEMSLKEGRLYRFLVDWQAPNEKERWRYLLIVKWAKKPEVLLAQLLPSF